MKLLPLVLTLPLMFANSALAQEDNCTWTVQGELEESDPRLNGTNAPFDMHTFTGTKGTKLFVIAESDYFNSEIALFKVTDGNFTMIDSDVTGTDWQQFTAWLYEDGEYAIRIASVKYEYPFNQTPERKFGYYTLQLSPFVCS